MDNKITRRGVLAGAGAVLAVTAVACDNSSGSAGAGGSGGGGGTSKGNPKEAPMLTSMVNDGKLPPLKKRLPTDPLVVKPNGGVGTYGGQLKVGLADSIPLGVQRMYFVAGYDNLVSWDAEFKEAVPNLAKSFSVNDDGTEWTFELREGTKWSDGHPFTAADIVFAVNDVLMNTELNPVPPSWIGPATATADGDYTVRLKLKVPNGILPQQIATQHGADLTTSPQHVMKKYHKKYNPSIDDLVKQEKYDNWMDLYASHEAFSEGHDSYHTPTLTAWRYVTAVDATPNVILERNPYYWKVDPQGSQLPYVDRLSFTRTNEQVTILKVSRGDFDFVMPDQRFADKPVYARNRDQGHFRFAKKLNEYMNNTVIHLNLTHKNPALREVFNNKDFRVGLSYAINRQEVTDAVYQKQGTPWNIAPRKESRYYDEQMGLQYTEHDVAKANQFLDKAYPKKNSDGIRLGPDGKPIAFKFDIATDSSAGNTMVDTAELVKKYWNGVGVAVDVNSMSRELLITTAEANRHDATMWIAEGGLDAIIMLNPYNYVPYISPPWAFYGVLWSQWYVTGGKQGDEPPASVKRQLKLYDQFKAETDQAKREGLMKEILGIAKDNFLTMGISLPPQSYQTVTDRVQNWPDFTAGGDWVYSSPGPTNPSQYYVGNA